MYFMKTNGTKAIAIAVLLLFTFSLYAQPKYDFRNASKIAGTDLQVGARYRFPNVRTGVDALVSITAITGGLTLNALDGTSSGFDEAFQPVITAPAHAKGYVEFTITFVTTGTSTPVTQTNVPVTPIDVDGQAGTVYEYDDIYLYNSSYVDYDMVGGELKMTFPSSNLVQGKNSAGVDYSGVDTSAKEVMFTVVNTNISTMVVRTGADNKSGSSQQRLRSLYFQKFTYPNSVLVQQALQSFRGYVKNNKVELQFTISSDNTLNTIVVQRANTPADFQAIGQILFTEDISQNSIHFTDNNILDEQAYYRLKMISRDGSVQYSTVLPFKPATEIQQSLKVFPSVIRSTATVSIKAGKSGSAIFRLADYAGRIVMQQVMNVQEGNNNIVVNNLGNLMSGNYVAVVNVGDAVYNQKVIKQ